MKTNELLILQHFLGKLEKSVEQEQLQEPINPAFLHLLTRDDLKNILLTMYENEEVLEKAHPNYYYHSNNTLLFEYIRDEYYILEYFTEVVIKKYIL